MSALKQALFEDIDNNSSCEALDYEGYTVEEVEEEYGKDAAQIYSNWLYFNIE